jgi:hypothetical protein
MSLGRHPLPTCRASRERGFNSELLSRKAGLAAAANDLAAWRMAGYRSRSPRLGGDGGQGLGLGIVRERTDGRGIGTTGPAMPLGVRGWTGPVAVGSG